MFGIVVILLVAAALAVGAVWLARVLRDEISGLRADSTEQLAGRNSEIDRRLVGITETMDRRFGELDTKVDRRLGEIDVKVDRRLAGMTETSVRVHEGLGKVGETTAQMNERLKGLERFEQMLRPPKARGGVGELMLKQLLADRPSGRQVRAPAWIHERRARGCGHQASTAPSSRSTRSSRSTTSSASPRPRTT